MNFTIEFFEFFVLYTISNFLIIVSSYITVPYKNLTRWEILKMAVPFAMLARVFQTQAMNIENTYKLLGANSVVFLLIVSQFFFTILANYFYLNEPVTISEIVAFALLLFAYVVNGYNLVSRFFNIPVLDASGNEIPLEPVQKDASGNNV